MIQGTVQQRMIQNNNLNNILHPFVAFKYDFLAATAILDEIEKTIRKYLVEEYLPKQKDLAMDMKNIDPNAIKVKVIDNSLESKTDVSSGETGKTIITDHNGTEVYSENVYIGVLGRFFFELDGFTKHGMEKDRATREKEFTEFVKKIGEYQNNPDKISDKTFSKWFLDYLDTFEGYLVDGYKDILAGGNAEEFDIKNFMKDKRFNWYLMPILIVKDTCFEKYLEHYVDEKKEKGITNYNELLVDGNYNREKIFEFIRLSKDKKIRIVNILRGVEQVTGDEAKKVGTWFQNEVKKPCDLCLKVTAVDLQEVKVTIDDKEWVMIAYLSKPLEEVEAIEGKDGENQIINFTNNAKSVILTNVEKFGLPGRLVIGFTGKFYIVRYNYIDEIDKFVDEIDKFVSGCRRFESKYNDINKNIDKRKEKPNKEYNVHLKEYNIEKYGMSTVKDSDESMEAIYAFYNGFMYKHKDKDGKYNCKFHYFGDSPEDCKFWFKLGVKIVIEDTEKIRKLENRLTELRTLILKQRESLLLEKGRRLLEEGEKLLKGRKEFLQAKLSGLKVVIKYNQYVHGKDKTLAQLFEQDFKFLKNNCNDEMEKTKTLIKNNGLNEVIDFDKFMNELIVVQTLGKDNKVISYDIRDYEGARENAKKEDKKKTSEQLTR